MSAPSIHIGVVVPADFLLDDEYWQLAGPDVVLHVTRIPVIPQQVDRSAAVAVGDPALVAEGVRLLGPTDSEVMVYACTAGSFIRGVSGEAALVETMRGAGAARAITTSGAIRAALDALVIERVSVATPYTSDLTAALVDYLDEGGTTVLGQASLELLGDIAQVPADRILDVLREADHPDAEAIVLSCTNLRTLSDHGAWEAALGKPVIGANQATIWAALRACAVTTTTIPGHLGRGTT